eukprot:2235436-Alexandrium_andersonii.AAC.1
MLPNLLGESGGVNWKASLHTCAAPQQNAHRHTTLHTHIHAGVHAHIGLQHGPTWAYTCTLA